MKKDEILSSMNYVDNKYIDEADTFKASKPKKPWIGIAAAAACFALCAAAAIGIHHRSQIKAVKEEIKTVQSESELKNEAESDSGTAEKIESTADTAIQELNEGAESNDSVKSEFIESQSTLKRVLQSSEFPEETIPTATHPATVEETTATAASAQSSRKGKETKETTIICSTTVAETWHELNWDELSTPSKFRGIHISGNEYVYTGDRNESRYSFRKATLIESGKDIKTFYQDKTYTIKADIYSLEGFDKALVIGVKFADSRYPHPYVNIEYTPSTLGELKKAIDWENTVTYGNLETKIKGVSISAPVAAADVNKYLLSSENLKNERENDLPGGKYVEFSVSCQELNLLNKTFRVYEDGYISTNLIGYRFIFNTGAKNSEAFLKAVCNNSFSDIGGTTAARLQYQAGITEITSEAHYTEE